VPYKGGGPAMNDLMAGHVDLLFASVLESIGQVKAGKLKTLGVSTATRSAAAPDIPTIAESGLKDFDSGSWLGLFAPAGTPPDIISKIAADVKAVLDDETTRQVLIQQGANPKSSTPAQLAALMEADRKRYARIIAEKNISLD
jgi:tripartite-type tricarboxylate transporter receptor subunit TctC